MSSQTEVKQEEKGRWWVSSEAPDYSKRTVVSTDAQSQEQPKQAASTDPQMTVDGDTVPSSGDLDHDVSLALKLHQEEQDAQYATNLEASLSPVQVPAPQMAKMTERGNEDDVEWEEHDVPTVDPTVTSETTDGTTKKKRRRRRRKRENGKDTRGCCRKLEEDENLFSLCIGALFCSCCFATGGAVAADGDCCECCDIF
ncbi:expressed unknown protein [Seminavis robusta]|uniref:Uncharacterized protein n=1 Tax=Seminavis robusta TaxID=568900 RepID=A0A9N8HWK8_9STRA|nr:expressed unknown protein [Seminavis robusta]|eukprot:Sro2693_g334820.1 n/a (199) ;mRNA; f:5932-6528